MLLLLLLLPRVMGAASKVNLVTLKMGFFPTLADSLRNIIKEAGKTLSQTSKETKQTYNGEKKSIFREFKGQQKQKKKTASQTLDGGNGPI